MPEKNPRQVVNQEGQIQVQGWMCFRSSPSSGQFGFTRLGSAAANGDVDGQVQLGRALVWQEVPGNVADGIMLLKVLAEKGNRDAQFNLGSFYKTGVYDGNSTYKWKDVNASITWLKRAFDAGLYRAAAELGYLYVEQKNAVEAARRFRPVFDSAFPD